MIAYEFNSKANNGFITIPEKYKAKIKSSVRVIVFTNKSPEAEIFKVKRKHKTLKQRLAEFYGENYDPAAIREDIKEVDWGKPVGEEVW